MAIPTGDTDKWYVRDDVVDSTTILYRLSFKVKSTVSSGVAGVGVTSSADNKVFAMYDASGNYWKRTVTTYGSIGADDWIEKSVIINLAKYHTTGASSNVAVDSLKNSEISDVNGVNILFYNYTNGVENCLYLKDIRLEQYTGDITYK